MPKKYSFFDEFNPIVTTDNNFDKILIQPDHVSRKRSDTFYVNEGEVLRTHTSAHQHGVIKSGEDAFCVLGDVYRKDEIDRSHYPAFHQMEAVRHYKVQDLRELVRNEFSGMEINQEEMVQNEAYLYFQDNTDLEENLKIVQLMVDDLKQTHEYLVKFLFDNADLQIRWNEDYFPFTEPSYEMEILWKDEWLEVLGSGIMHKDVLNFANVDSEENIGWASGIGLERFAILLFEVPDIRLFWSEDDRFIEQFEKGKITRFEPFSKYPACSKDVAFYLGDDVQFEENDLHSLVREHGGDLIEEVKLIDYFENKKLGKISRCYRINYRSLERTLTNEEIDVIQFKIRDDMEEVLGYELR